MDIKEFGDLGKGNLDLEALGEMELRSVWEEKGRLDFGLDGWMEIRVIGVMSMITDWIIWELEKIKSILENC